MKISRALLWSVALATTSTVNAQTVTTQPAILTTSDNAVTITFHADGGNRALFDRTGDVFAHTGLITSSSKDCSDWKYSPTWGAK